MKNSQQSIGVAGVVLLSCVALSVPAGAQMGDSLQIQNVVPPPQTPLVITPSERTRISVTVNYVLSSAGNASLSLYAEEYPEAAGGCRGNVSQTDGGSYLAIQRGKGTATIVLIWPDLANHTSVYPKGYVTLGAAFWAPDRTRQIRDFGLFPKICYHFAPGVSPPNVTGSPTGRPSPPSPPTGQSMPVFYRWQRASNGSVPAGAVIGGYSSVRSQPGSTAVSYGTPYYVCRAASNNGIFPGKLVGKNCNYSAATGKEILANNYEVLTEQSGEYSLVWRQSATPPKNAVVGGRWGEDLYVCQLSYKGGIHSGWAIPQQGGQYKCSIGEGGQEVVLGGFSFLVPIKGQAID